MDPPKRRLPLVDAGPGRGADEDRPPWHWVGFGAVALFAVWLPLASLAEALKGRAARAWIGDTATEEDARRALAALDGGARAKLLGAVVLPHALALALAALGAGYLVGRFGAPAGPREAALAGVVAVAAASLLGVASGGGAGTLVAGAGVGAVTAGVAALGARLGRRARRTA